MANLGFYSRHLTEEEVQGITATTRRLILGNTQVSVLDSCPAQLPPSCLLVVVQNILIFHGSQFPG